MFYKLKHIWGYIDCLDSFIQQCVKAWSAGVTALMEHLCNTLSGVVLIVIM